MSARESIKTAYAQLLQERRPITRRAIADIAGCDMRTVSKHKDVWSEHAAFSFNVRLPASELLSVKLAQIDSKLDDLPISELNSLRAALELLARYAHTADEKQRVTQTERALEERVARLSK